ncbi:DNA helicase RecQ [Acidiphilium sp. JA12-A1]|uniref:DNA helicase RecQ n=1 Tax=Acidiphilium sp. JA12-A1 TaxID=1464546 RepID=UPI000461A2C8|nr:DNA helicase RecQ [Acidiphilium sp. JA12-A1]KDM67856.1 ATP-dependent DNA helicase RecQ [Acidiphilium sp. JA12-A1]MDE2326413.1 DNA helicase RecQ [Rhodospirillales bacterium]
MRIDPPRRPTEDIAIEPEAVLRRVFGHDGFRGPQRDIVTHVIAGHDALVLMPTGGGKSICYQLPAICRRGVGIVVSPLIALMRNQVEALRQLGVSAAAFNSSLEAAERATVLRALRAGELDLLYVAPERLVTEDFLALLGSVRIALFAIDEAHCVSQWGHDFRPEYLQLATIGERFPGVPRIALTATADPQTRDDIARRLGLDGARLFISSFDRPNLTYAIAPKIEPRRQLLAFLRGHEGECGIVYCLSRAAVEETASWLAGQGLRALPYHAGLDAATRNRNQDAFLGEDGLILVATIAFGMGIDKPDIRFVAHLDLPSSLEAYYQETGRAGRDGAPAETLMLYGMQDVALRGRLIDQSDAPDEVKRIARAKLGALLGVCETAGCRRRAVLAHFGETYPGDCGRCDNCRTPVQTWDGTEAARKALSAILRTGQRFGVGHLTDILRGTATDRIRHLGHDRLPTFGVGADLDRRQWGSVFRQLAVAGLVEIDHEAYGALRITERARPVLRGEEALRLRRDPATGRKGGQRSTAGPSPAIEAPGFEALREWRREVARSQQVPAYVIFHDATLAALAAARPSSRRDLAAVPGMGTSKIERYGDAVLAVLARTTA